MRPALSTARGATISESSLRDAAGAELAPRNDLRTPMRSIPTLASRAARGLALALLGACSTPGGDDAAMPEGWSLVYRQDFERHPGLDFVVSDARAWRVGEDDGNRFLEQFRPSDYAPPHRSPLNVAVLAGPCVGDFVLEVDVQQTGREMPHRDACVFFGVQDPAHLLYAHLASRADDDAHHVQIVDGHDRVPVTLHRSFGVEWGSGTWHRVRMERSLTFERVRVWVDGRSSPVLEARVGAFAEGWVGLGTFDDSARFDNLRLWAPQYTLRSPDFFEPLAAEASGSS